MDRRKVLLIVALIGGILIIVGLFLPWGKSGWWLYSWSYSGWDTVWYSGLPYLISVCGILVIVGSLLALLEAFGVPKLRTIDYLLPIGGIIAGTTALGTFFWWGLQGRGFNFEYGFYSCLIGSVLPVISHFVGGEGKKKEMLQIVGLIGGILIIGGVFLPWSWGYSGWTISWYEGYPYLVLIGGILIIVGSLLALLEAFGISAPKLKTADHVLPMLFPISGIVVAIGIWGALILGWGGLDWVGLEYGFLVCLIGSALSLAGYFGGGKKPETLIEWGRTQMNLGMALALIGLAVPGLAWIMGAATVLLVVPVFTIPCEIAAIFLKGRGGEARYRAECEIIETEVNQALRSKEEVTLEEIASKTGVGFDAVRRRVERWLRKGRFPGVYLEAGILTRRRGVSPPAVAPRERVKLRPKLRLAQIESMVYGYIVSHGGEIGIAECAEELGLSETEVVEAVEGLRRKGKIEKEEVAPAIKPAKKKPKRR